MSDIIRPGAGILFMKVGTHAKETLADIIARKTREIEDAGYALWGYGGNTCHPRTMVQPFARAFQQSGGKIYLCMHEMESKHRAERVRADEFSEDGFTWNAIPRTINVIGSRYALVIKTLQLEEMDLPLGRTRVAIGNNKGRAGDRYISGRVDKACLEVTGEGQSTPGTEGQEQPVKVNLVAELITPFAVFLRNRS